MDMAPHMNHHNKRCSTPVNSIYAMYGGLSCDDDQTDGTKSTRHHALIVYHAANDDGWFSTTMIIIQINRRF